MTSDTLATFIPAAPNARINTDDPMAAQVRHFLTRLLPPRTALERRQSGRFPFPFLIRLTPVDEVTLSPVDEPMVVVGKDLSEKGLGFYHQPPLPYRRAVVTLEDSAGRSVSLLIELSWCRFTRHGWYDSGGRFLRIMQPLAA